MKKSTKFSDILHLLLHMASSEKPVKSDILAKSISSNPAFVRKTMAGLRELNLVHSEKGHRGGWTLLCNLEDVFLYDIYIAVGEPAMLAIGTRSSSSECAVEQAVNETTGNVFKAAEDMIIEKLKNTSLADLHKAMKKKSENK